MRYFLRKTTQGWQVRPRKWKNWLPCAFYFDPLVFESTLNATRMHLASIFSGKINFGMSNFSLTLNIWSKRPFQWKDWKKMKSILISSFWQWRVEIPDTFKKAICRGFFHHFDLAGYHFDCGIRYPSNNNSKNESESTNENLNF